MVYFAYNHIVFVSLLAFVAVNARAKLNELQVELLEKTTAGFAREIFQKVVDIEEFLQDYKNTILSEHASSKREIEKYLDCLQTAYKYFYGETAFDAIEKVLFLKIDDSIPLENYFKVDEMVKHAREKALAYTKKKEEFPVHKCSQHIPSVLQKEAQEVDKLHKSLFKLKYEIGVLMFGVKLYATLLKQLKENRGEVPE
ncbi:unnamed protein product [Trichobilharzia szidati]|nr:unnamed protein product [Trichobilharzia szidati]